MEMDESKIMRIICDIFSILAGSKKHKMLSRIHVKLKKNGTKSKPTTKLKPSLSMTKPLGFCFFLALFLRDFNYASMLVNLFIAVRYEMGFFRTFRVYNKPVPLRRSTMELLKTNVPNKFYLF